MLGKILAHYKILEKIGAGGMGEVYRAQDTKLHREVAIKILPREMSGDPERIARFEREARVLASLQHTNVASIYGFEDLPEARFLVMELVDGEDLSERMARGPIETKVAVEIACQIALGLEAAHDQGIVHRDLKPTNVKVAADGTVKVLDFGLARAYTGDSGAETNPEFSPTITAAMTLVGTVLGTAAYMSPEQARGKAVDQRTDIWSLGVILFEMLSGERLFAGETISDILAGVLRAELDFAQVPKGLPANVDRVLRRSLVRDRRQRLRSAGDVWLELMAEESAQQAGNVTAPPSRFLYTGGCWPHRGRDHFIFVLRSEPTAEPGRPTYLSIALPDGALLDEITANLAPVQ